MGSLTEPDGDVEYVADGRPAIGLCVAATPAVVYLGEHEVISWHYSAGRIQRQS